jgi:hypothetical protein
VERAALPSREEASLHDRSPLDADRQALDLARESPGEVAEWLKALAC